MECPVSALSSESSETDGHKLRPMAMIKCNDLKFLHKGTQPSPGMGVGVQRKFSGYD